MFGHSDAHVALQIADIVASALLFPMACAAYCYELGKNVTFTELCVLREVFGAIV